jgi:predicted component of type VI protein secretion system
VPKGLSRKNDLVVWLRLKPLQRAVYEAFLHSEAVGSDLLCVVRAFVRHAFILKR